MSFVMEDLEFHKHEKDYRQQIVYLQFQNAALKHKKTTQEAIKKEKQSGKMSLPDTEIEPLEMIQYSSLNFHELEEEMKYQQRYLAVEIITDPFISKDDFVSFLAKDKASDSNRIIRVQIRIMHDGWAPSFFQIG